MFFSPCQAENQKTFLASVQNKKNALYFKVLFSSFQLKNVGPITVKTVTEQSHQGMFFFKEKGCFKIMCMLREKKV